MDSLKRPAILEDAVQYKLFLVQPDPSNTEVNERSLQQLLENILAEVAPLLVQYIWQHQSFNLRYHPEKGDEPAHLGGVTVFADNVEDEWFIVYLLKSITRTFKEVAAVVYDNDGQFLLIEAAEHLPKWLDPAGIAVVLSRSPDIIAPAVSAFYLRDPLDLQACRTFRNFSLLPPIGDAWLDISPQELERLLEERGGRKVIDSTRKTVGPEDEEQEEETGYSLVAVTQGMKNFINAMSSHEGAEIPRSCLAEPFSFDPDAVTSALDRLLGNKDDELDSDDFEEDDDEEDNLNKDVEVENAGSKEQAGTETLESLRKYMDEMDQELQSTNIGKSFTQTNKTGSRSGASKSSSSVTSGSEPVEEEIQPLDVDLNLVTNLLESLASQAGLAGPASNLLQSLGIHIPPDADKS